MKTHRKLGKTKNSSIPSYILYQFVMSLLQHSTWPIKLV